jgi:hypothetical protein
MGRFGASAAECFEVRPVDSWFRWLRACRPSALVNRIDLHIEVPAVTAADLILPPTTEKPSDGLKAKFQHSTASIACSPKAQSSARTIGDMDRAAHADRG